MLRRSFLETVPGALAAAAVAAPTGTGVPVKLGFDTYSLRAFRWKAPELLNYAAALKLDTIQISSLSDYENFEPAYLRSVKEQAERLHLQIDGGMGCICPSSHSFSKNGPPARDRLLQGLRVAAAVGAKSMRCYLGTGADRIGEPGIDAHIANTIQLFRSVRSETLDLGMKIAIENHNGDMQAREVKTLIEESGRDFVGSNLDAGNPLWVVEDPLLTLEILAPYVITSHVRDSVLFEHPRGAAGQWVALGDGQIDLARFVELFRKWCPQAPIQLEIITGRPPRVVPYLEQDFWKVFPNALASDFARFVALAKSGHPFMGAMVIEDVDGGRPAIMNDALKEQQRIDLERSLEYAKKQLNVGINWRS